MLNLVVIIIISFSFLRALFGRDDDHVNTCVVNLMRALNVDRRAIVSLMLDNTSFRTIRAIQEVLSHLI